jgi:tetratricopeptide (TPR) repeat protein
VKEAPRSVRMLSPSSPAPPGFHTPGSARVRDSTHAHLRLLRRRNCRGAREHLGLITPPSVYNHWHLVMSLAGLGRFAEAAEYEAEAIRLAEPTHHAVTVAMAHWAAGMLYLSKGDWARACSLREPWVAAARTGNIVFLLPAARATSAWALSQLGEAGQALNRLREAERAVPRRSDEIRTAAQHAISARRERQQAARGPAGPTCAPRATTASPRCG